MRSPRSFACLYLAVVSITTASPALALVNRVFVSARSGNNANACDNILTPCQTFAGAVTQLNPDGEVIVLDSGGYGPVTITQGVTIEAAAGVTAFIHPPAGDAITVSAGLSDTVVLRGLTLNISPGVGIQVNSVGQLFVENCVIHGFVYGINFQTAGKLSVKDTTIRKCVNDGIRVQAGSGTASASVAHSRLEASGFGMTVADRGKASIRDSVISGNSDGLVAYTFNSGVSAELNVESCLVANNSSYGVAAWGGASTSGGLVKISGSIVTDNGTGLTQLLGTLNSRNNNTVEGNSTDTSGIGTFFPK